MCTMYVRECNFLCCSLLGRTSCSTQFYIDILQNVHTKLFYEKFVDLPDRLFQPNTTHYLSQINGIILLWLFFYLVNALCFYIIRMYWTAQRVLLSALFSFGFETLFFCCLSSSCNWVFCFILSRCLFNQKSETERQE